MDVLIRIQKSIAPKSKINPEEEKILVFCNSKNIINKISKQTKKTKKSVERILEKLRGKGIIQSLKIKGRTVHSKV